MKHKNLFFIVCLFILLFGFKLDVYAAPAYYFEVSDLNSDDIEFVNFVCNNPTKYHGISDDGDVFDGSFCSFRDKFDKTWTNALPLAPTYYDAFYFFEIEESNVGDNAKILSGIQAHLRNLTCGDMGCYEYVAKNYCGDKTNKFTSNKQICSELAKIDGESNGGTVFKTCPSTFVSVTPNYQAALTLTLVYRFSDDTLTYTYNAEQNVGEKVKNFVRKNNDYFYLYPKGKDFSFFTNDLKNKYVQSGFDCSGNLGVLCLSSSPESVLGQKREWYIELDASNCTEANGYIEGVSQKMGDDSNATELDAVLSKSLTNYAHKFAESLDHTTLASIESCEDLFGNDNHITNILKIFVNVVKFIVPIILIVMGSLDFIQAIFAQDDGAMKKAQGKFIKRVIIAVIIFLVPSALKLILTIANSIWPNISADFCGIL